MNILGKIADKIKLGVKFISKGNSKIKTKENKGVQVIDKKENGNTTILNIQTDTLNITDIQALAGSNQTEDTDQDLLKNASQRLYIEQLIKQDNFRRVVQGAKLDSLSPMGSIDRDWYLRWSDVAQNVGKEDLQNILSNILSKEIQNPESYSIRTLNFLQSIKKEELILFKKLALLSNFDYEGVYITKDNLNDGFFNFSYSKIMTLIELGLIQASLTTIRKFGELKIGKVLIFKFSFLNKILLLSKKDNTEFNLPFLSFTQIGSELASLYTSNDSDISYLEVYRNELKEFLSTKDAFIADSEIEITVEIVKNKDNEKK